MTMTIKQLQLDMKPWAVEPHFSNNADPCFMLKHALFHATKATGKIAGAADEHDHSGASGVPAVSFRGCEKYLADLVICAMKMASETGVDLGQTVEDRMRDKGLL
jgi:hypothetical protein